MAGDGNSPLTVIFTKLALYRINIAGKERAGNLEKAYVLKEVSTWVLHSNTDSSTLSWVVR